ncbi:uncharacterized protein SPSK_08449 [Sporothrix schenckii 1099-18]|uniref:Uncharacterized protein n=1 Tax=Sporothrix schenckii 1099-18 TaxID=1397361 RepID=A0A0F2MAX7_SPOSC|nr:uncharacterized protein SPSK_08449 [Sporothrix schenckii 1099-18]KJR85955.1 hypothetical protein SPSK_08449 [Sporothrix schenckii 1099-18]
MGTPTFLDTAPAPPIYRHGNSDILPAWSQREAAAAEQPWTATRCHRQLRPLLTHLMALRRETARAVSKQRNNLRQQNTSPSKRPTADDCVAGRKRVRYTYSLKGTGRRRYGQPGAINESAAAANPADGDQTSRVKVAPLKQQAARSFCPGEVVVATPVLSRARKHRQAWSMPSSPIMSTVPTDAGDVSVIPTVTGGNENTSRPNPRNPGFKYRGYYQNPSRPGANSSSSPSIDSGWAAVEKATPAEFHHLYDSIFRAVDALLRSTTSTLEPTRKSNSLFAMCLRKVPQYVTMCEEAEREEAEKEGVVQLPSSSVSFGIYSDLESLGSETSGWKHLRVVVREHGIDMLKSACVEGLLHDTFVRLLVRLCTHLNAHDEAENLVTALFDSHRSSLPKGQHICERPHDTQVDLSGSPEPLALLGMLLQYSDETGRTSTSLRQIAELLNNDQLQVAWLSTQAFSSLWHRAIRLLSSRGPPVCEETSLLQFFATAIAKLVHSRSSDDISDPHPKAAPQSTTSSKIANTTPLTSSSSYHTIVSILGSICAIGILQQEASLDSCDTNPLTRPAVVKRVVAVVQRSLSDISQKIKARKGQHRLDVASHCYPRQYLLMLALCLLQSMSTSKATCCVETKTDTHSSSIFDETRFREFIATASPTQSGQIYDATIAFVTFVAECCGRGSESTLSSAPVSQAYLRKLSSHAAHHLYSPSDSDSYSNYVCRLQADAAFLLASRSNDLRDLAFAESLSKSAVQKDEHRLPPCHLPNSGLLGASGLPYSKTCPPAAAALFDGYRWEEGISEWVVSTPHAPSSRPASAPKASQKSELVIIIDSIPPPELAVLDTKRSLRRPMARSSRFSLPTSTPLSSQSPLGSDQDSDNDTASSPRTPGSQSDVPSFTRRQRTRSLQAVSPAWQSKPRPGTTRRLLSIVSDNDDADENNYQETACNETVEPVYTTEMPAGMSLFGLAGGSKKADEAWASTGNVLGKAAPVRRSRYRPAGNDVDVASSDDELCL